MATTTRTAWHRLALPNRADDAFAWPTRGHATDHLNALRECGLNLDRRIEVSRANTALARGVWVVILPDHHEVTTSLMTFDGRWLPGRLNDAPCFCEPACTDHPVPWTPLGATTRPPLVTHAYAYTEGSGPVGDGLGRTLLNGNGTERLTWTATAWCLACTWSWTDTTESAVRSAARHHRAHPEQHSGHTTARRAPVLPDPRRRR